jgi:hypothetical protein
MKHFLPVEQNMIKHAQRFADMSNKSWEVFRDARGAVDLALSGTCAQEPKFRLLMTVKPINEGMTR